MSESAYKEIEMAELRMSEFVFSSITLERVVDDGKMSFQVGSDRDHNGSRNYTQHETELAAKQDFMSRVRLALALPEGMY